MGRNVGILLDLVSALLLLGFFFGGRVLGLERGFGFVEEILLVVCIVIRLLLHI